MTDLEKLVCDIKRNLQHQITSVFPMVGISAEINYQTMRVTFRFKWFAGGNDSVLEKTLVDDFFCLSNLWHDGYLDHIANEVIKDISDSLISKRSEVFKKSRS